MGLWSRLFGGREDVPARRSPTVGDWTIAIPSDFELIDNGDSWQACKDDRVVYIGSLSANRAKGRKVPARELHAMGAKKLDGAGPGERSRITTANLMGEAQIARTESGWQLTGFMVTDGVIATCVIDFQEESGKGWALSTWQSLDHP